MRATCRDRKARRSSRPGPRPGARHLQGAPRLRPVGRRDGRSETPAFLRLRVRAPVCGATVSPPRFRFARREVSWSRSTDTSVSPATRLLRPTGKDGELNGGAPPRLQASGARASTWGGGTGAWTSSGLGHDGSRGVGGAGADRLRASLPVGAASPGFGLRVGSGRRPLRGLPSGISECLRGVEGRRFLGLGRAVDCVA